jgi:hypothetical protein
MLRFGLLLIALSFLPWIILPFVPWLPFLTSPSQKASAGGILIVLAEILFWGGLLAAGKEVWREIRLHGWRETPGRLYRLFRHRRL